VLKAAMPKFEALGGNERFNDNYHRRDSSFPRLIGKQEKSSFDNNEIDKFIDLDN